MPGPTSPRAIAESVYRTHYGTVLAHLVRYLGDLDLAEDALQDAVTRAMEVWPIQGVPDRPAGWLVTTAKNRAIDRIRRTRTATEKSDELRHWATLSAEAASPVGIPGEIDDAVDMAHTAGIPDDRLRLIFTACHPALAIEARVALTLKTLCGLTTREIARSFLVPEATMAQRLVRAKKKIRLAKIPYEIPEADRLPERVDAVLAVVYLVFNEGYTASEGTSLVRQDLSREAIRLGQLLIRLLPGEAEVLGLVALLLLHDARREARVAPDGSLITLEQQDRTLWNRAQIQEGLSLLDLALKLRNRGPYQIQAGIAALHARAPRPQDTDWPQIVALYETLLDLTGSAVVELNLAAAVAMAEGPDVGLDRLDRIAQNGQLDGYHLFHAARADLLRRAGRFEEAIPAYNQALALTTNRREQDYLKRRLENIRSHRG